ncbi:MAG: helix-turn-helix domain-containing protein [Treponema sp.]|nr:helix-turn-helix domain-containing protein [Treponema sp.]
MREKITESDIRLLVSRNLKRLRTLQNYSQLRLGLDADLSANFINDLEKCHKSASLETIAKLSTALKVEPHLFFMSDEVPGDTQIYMSAFKNDLQRYVNNWTDSYLPSEQEKKQ